MIQSRKVPRWHKVIYLTRPDFLKHDHIHRRKIELLRGAGIKASLLSVVPQPLYEHRRAEYQAATADGMRQVICVPEQAQANERVREVVLRELLRLKRVVVHVLLCDPAPVLRLRRMPFFGRRLRCIIEHEGDIASEWLYIWAYKKYAKPPDLPPPDYKPTYDRIVEEQKAYLLQADGVILVTTEQRGLWEQRLNRKLNALTLPTYFDPSRFSFSAAGRERVRTELNLGKKIVLVYSGSVSMAWQRFERVCQLTGTLARRGHPVHLLALVHTDGHAAAREQIEQAGIAELTILKSVPAGEMAAHLSASDVALFLRHDHLMNRIVTSAKLGEYLAAGLPLLTTWACPYYRPFVEQHGASVTLPDSLELPERFDNSFTSLAAMGKDADWRGKFSSAVRAAFSEENDPLKQYVEFVKGMLRGSEWEHQ